MCLRLHKIKCRAYLLKLICIKSMAIVSFTLNKQRSTVLHDNLVMWCDQVTRSAPEFGDA